MDGDWRRLPRRWAVADLLAGLKLALNLTGYLRETGREDRGSGESRSGGP